MTMDRTPISSEEWQQQLEALKERYMAGEMDDTELRIQLARLGLNATEIEEIFNIIGGTF